MSADFTITMALATLGAIFIGVLISYKLGLIKPFKIDDNPSDDKNNNNNTKSPLSPVEHGYCEHIHHEQDNQSSTNQPPKTRSSFVHLFFIRHGSIISKVQPNANNTF